MTDKEKLIFEMENLSTTLKDYLKFLEEGEIDEMACQRLGEGMFSVTWALRYYLGDIPLDSAYIADIDPDIQGMKFE